MITWLLIGSLAMLGAFAFVWIIGLKIHNYSFLDVIWSYGVAILAPIYAIAGPGQFERKLAFTILGVAWSLRLGTYILLRVLKHHPQEDVRYAGLRQRWPGAGMFLLFHELQALIVIVFSLPFLLAAWQQMALRALDWIGLGIVLIALVGETIADRQMQRFKAVSSNRGRVCQVGLWRYSRHPNYFFEFLVWVGFALASVASPHGWVTLLCPILMYYFLTRVTGIPLTEEYSLKSKGDAFRHYQRTTNAFFPWFPKSPEATPS
jgi:steroid 5-alpha reductase family enzyme